MTKALSAFLLLFLGLTITARAQSQDFRITGSIMDSITKEPLEAATVFAEAFRDSTLVSYTITDAQGVFELEGNTGISDVNLIVSFVGYKPWVKRIDLNKESDLTFNNIGLSASVESLNDVVIVGRIPPISFKQDTTEFNVASFQTKKDANVEDLLRKLPGFEVDENGAVTVNGIPVNKVLVNGKPFFGNDPTIATRNLTKEIVEKIQVVDSRTRTEAFTGEPSDGENKTVNIKIAKDKNRGTFGRVAAGGGTDERFEYAGIANYFDNDLRLSALGGGNNINRAGFNFGEVSNTFGRGAAWSITEGGGNDGGITNSRVAGANYADDWGKKTNQATANYIYTASNTFEDSKTDAESVVPVRNQEGDDPDATTTQFSTSTRSSYNTSDRHNLNPEYETVIDSAYYIEYRPDFSYNESFGRNSSQQVTSDENREILNESSANSSNNSIGRNLNSRLDLTRRYGKGGGYIRLDLDNSWSENDSYSEDQSETVIYAPGTQGSAIDSTIVRDQFTDGSQENTGINTRLRWKAPIIANLFFLSTEYSYDQSKRNNKAFVFDQNESGPSFNTEQSTDFSNQNYLHRPGMGLEYRDDKLNVETEAALILRELASQEAINNIDFNNKFEAMEIEVNVRYRFSRNTRLRFGYDLENDIPSIQQLSPYVDVSNPLFIRTGNPNLNPTVQNRFNLNFNTYNVAKEANFYVYSRYDIQSNDIIQKTENDGGVRTSTFVNVDGNYSLRAGFGYGKNIKIDSLNSLRYNVGMNFNISRRQNFTNEVLFNTETESYTPRLGINYNYLGKMRLQMSYNPNFTFNKFDIDNRDDTYFLRHNAAADLLLTFGKLEFENVLNYTYNSNIQPGFQKGSLFWNSSIQYSILKDNGLITLRGYDILKQNTNARRFASGDAVIDRESTVLERYFMLGFTYKLNTLGKEPPGSDRDRGRRYRGRRY
ncbi:MAG: outer membrane beta-barrel protein [Leeuwenhoekiella sp.]